VGNVRGRNPSFFILIFPLPQVNGSELAIISLIASENAFRLPESMPCLHDKVLAAAAEAAINASMDQKRNQVWPC
jgi:hypothetical protein